MSLGLLGDGFDLHGGGLDLAFPHHENERAQAVALGSGLRKALGAQRLRRGRRREDVQVARQLHVARPTCSNAPMPAPTGSWFSAPLPVADRGHPGDGRRRREAPWPGWTTWRGGSVDPTAWLIAPCVGAVGAGADADRTRVRFAERMDDDLDTPAARPASSTWPRGRTRAPTEERWSTAPRSRPPSAPVSRRSGWPSRGGETKSPTRSTALSWTSATRHGQRATGRGPTCCATRS